MGKSNNIEQISAFNTPEESPGYLLWRVSLAWRNEIEEALRASQLTHPQFVILATTAWLTKSNRHTSQIDVSRASGLDPNTTSQVLRGLELRGLICRNRSLNEKSKNPSLTDAGLETLETALPAVEKADRAFLEPLTEEEVHNLTTLFQKIKTTQHP